MKHKLPDYNSFHFFFINPTINFLSCIITHLEREPVGLRIRVRVGLFFVNMEKVNSWHRTSHGHSIIFPPPFDYTLL